VEREFDILRNRLEKDFVSRYEMEQLRNSYEMALSRAKYEAEMAARDDLNEKLCQINTFIEKQVGTSVDIPLSFVHSVQQEFKNLNLSQVCCRVRLGIVLLEQDVINFCLLPCDGFFKIF